MHLDENRLGIFYEPNKRVLDCYYEPELEDLIIENLRGVVHVTGSVQLDSEGNPDKIVGVTEIAPLDLRPIRLKTVESPEGTLIFRKSKDVVPAFESQQVMIEIPELNIVASGATRDEAVRELYSDLIWLWKEYGLAKDEDLSSDARELKQLLLEMVEEAALQ